MGKMSYFPHTQLRCTVKESLTIEKNEKFYTGSREYIIEMKTRFLVGGGGRELRYFMRCSAENLGSERIQENE